MLNSDLKKLEITLRREIYSNSYYEFFKWSFNILEPQTKLEDTFHIRYLCDLLQAEVERIIRKEEKGNDIIINIPPRTSKSKILSQALLAWAWIKAPSLKMISVSYSDKLSLSNASYCKDIIKSDQYQLLFGDIFQIRKDIDSKERFANDKGGERLSTTIGGSITGFGAEIVCLPAGQRIATSGGCIDIKTIVDQRLPVKILTYNHTTGNKEFKDILSYQTNPSRKLIKITSVSGKELICTEDHHVFTSNRGYVPAKELIVDDLLIIN